MPSRIACLRFAKLVAFSVLLIAALCLVPPAWGRDFGEWPDIPAVMAGGVSDEEVEETMGSLLVYDLTSDYAGAFCDDCDDDGVGDAFTLEAAWKRSGEAPVIFSLIEDPYSVYRVIEFGPANSGGNIFSMTGDVSEPVADLGEGGLEEAERVVLSQGDVEGLGSTLLDVLEKCGVPSEAQTDAWWGHRSVSESVDTLMSSGTDYEGAGYCYRWTGLLEGEDGDPLYVEARLGCYILSFIQEGEEDGWWPEQVVFVQSGPELFLRVSTVDVRTRFAEREDGAWEVSHDPVGPMLQGGVDGDAASFSDGESAIEGSVYELGGLFISLPVGTFELVSEDGGSMRWLGPRYMDVQAWSTPYDNAFVLGEGLLCDVAESLCRDNAPSSTWADPAWEGTAPETSSWHNENGVLVACSFYPGFMIALVPTEGAIVCIGSSYPSIEYDWEQGALTVLRSLPEDLEYILDGLAYARPTLGGGSSPSVKMGGVRFSFPEDASLTRTSDYGTSMGWSFGMTALLVAMAGADPAGDDFQYTAQQYCELLAPDSPWWSYGEEGPTVTAYTNSNGVRIAVASYETFKLAYVPIDSSEVVIALSYRPEVDGKTAAVDADSDVFGFVIDSLEYV